MKRTVEDLCEFIWELEGKYNLLDFEIDGVKIWQYLRIEIYYLMAKELGVLEQRNISQQSKGVLFKSSLILLKNLFVANPFLTINKKREVLIFSHSRSQKNDDNFEDIYTQSLIRNLDDSKQSYLCFEKPSRGKHVRRRNSHTRYLDFILSASILYGKLYRVKDQGGFDVIHRVEKEIMNTTANSIDLISLFKHNIGRFRLANKLYLILFRKIKPKVIYSVSSYSYLGDMISAAKSLGIKTIELQHGVISKYHMGYSFLKKIDLEYYSDVFYSWGSFWNKSVDNAFEEIEVNGFQYFQDTSKKYQDVEKENKILILSQAALGGKIMNETLKFINTFSNFQILYKLHPSEYNMYKEYSSYSMLSSYENITFLEDCNLYQLMSVSKIQIGVFSTAIYEGLGFSCKTYLFDLNGIEYMQDLIDSEYATVLSVGIDISLKESKKNSVNNFF